jgi:hypothetical protein
VGGVVAEAVARPQMRSGAPAWTVTATRAAHARSE